MLCVFWCSNFFLGFGDTLFCEVIVLFSARVVPVLVSSFDLSCWTQTKSQNTTKKNNNQSLFSFFWESFLEVYLSHDSKGKLIIFFVCHQDRAVWGDFSWFLLTNIIWSVECWINRFTKDTCLQNTDSIDFVQVHFGQEKSKGKTKSHSELNVLIVLNIMDHTLNSGTNELWEQRDFNESKKEIIENKQM